MPWRIISYESANGQRPVAKFIKSLSPVTRTKLVNKLNLLEEFGPALLMPHVKPIGGGFYELRVRGKQEVRIIFIFVRDNKIYLLHGFVKKSRFLPRVELNIAVKRKNEIEII